MKPKLSLSSIPWCIARTTAAWTLLVGLVASLSTAWAQTAPAGGEFPSPTGDNSPSAGAPETSQASIEIVLPKDGDSFVQRNVIQLIAAITDPDSRTGRRIAEFYDGEDLIGQAIASPGPAPGDGLFFATLAWRTAVPGKHTLTARYHPAGSGIPAVVSKPVRITVTPVMPVAPTVALEATEPETTEPSPQARVKPAVIQLSRTEPAAEPLRVLCALEGTAELNRDYRFDPEPEIVPDAAGALFTLPAGTRVLEIRVVPLEDDLVEGDETIILRLDSTLFPWPPGYFVNGRQAEARVVIHDAVHPPPPAASLILTEPQDGTRFPRGAPILIRATAIDPAGYLPRAEFLADGERIGVSEINFFVAPDPGTPIEHEFLWTQAPPGRHELVAQTATSAGVLLRSDPVLIHVSEDPPFEQVILEVTALDPMATEPIADAAPDTALFLIQRVAGPLDVALTAFYRLSGKAENGVDYEKLSGEVRLEAGERAAEIVVVPLADDLDEGEEPLILQLLAPPCIAIFPPPPECYAVGAQDTARAVIRDAASDNHPPRVAVLSPQTGAVFAVGDPIELLALAGDPDGYVPRVEFFADGEHIGVSEINFLVPPDPGTPIEHHFLWADAPPGPHVLVARAHDDGGRTADSAPVKILVRDAVELSFVTRDLPPAYVPGTPFPVSLLVEPPRHGAAHAVEDQPPAGWEVSRISHDGVFDAAHGKVKWGPFTDQRPRTLTYLVTPPAAATGPHEFQGTGSLDGKSYPTLGDSRIEPAGTAHPADLDPEDFALTADKLTAYAAAWKRGEPWPIGPNPIPHSYVSRAGFLWQTGESYVFDPTQGPAPLCWLPAAPVPEPDPGVPGHAGAGMVEGGRDPQVHRQMPARWFPGSPTTVRLVVHPPRDTRAWAVEEAVPTGWAVSALDETATFDPATSRIRWGLFLDDQPRTLTYDLTPPKESAGLALFVGEASFDGTVEPVRGNFEALALQAGRLLRIKALARQADGRVQLVLEGQADQLVTVEASSDLVHWTELPPLLFPGDEAVCEDQPGSQPHRFYRVRPLAR